MKSQFIEISERVRDHLENQKIVSMDSNENCQYREGPLRCAVGCLITDEFYSEGLEGCALEESLIQSAVCHSLGLNAMHPELEELLSKWQSYHDDGRYGLWCDSPIGAPSPAEVHEVATK